MKRFMLILLLSVQLLAACASQVTLLGGTQETPLQAASESTNLPGNGSASKTLMVFADDSLRNALAAIGPNIQDAHPGTDINIQFGDSGTLRQQIEQGVHADIFISANPAEMDLLVAGKLVEPQAVNSFLANQVLIVLPAINKSDLGTLQDLTRPGVKIVMVNKDLTLGKYTQQVLDNLDKSLGAGYKEGVLKNVVSYETDAAKVLEKVQMGTVDAGFVYVSDLAAAPQLKSILIPAENNVPVAYSMAVLSKASNPELAQIFIDFVLSPTGEAVFQKWKFLYAR